MRRFILPLFIVIAAAYIGGVIGEWFYHVWWYDIMMHLAGGAWVALVFLEFCVRDGRVAVGQAAFSITALLTLGVVAFIGVLWEFAEYIYDVVIASRHPFIFTGGDVADTLGDLLNDLVGGLAAVFVFRRSA